MSSDASPVVPELACADLERSLAFYVDVLGWRVLWEKPEQRFCYMDLLGANFILQERPTEAVTVRTGVDAILPVKVEDLEALYARVLAAGIEAHGPLEERWYPRAGATYGERQFYVIDPDGHRLRFVQDIGTRPNAAGAGAP